MSKEGDEELDVILEGLNLDVMVFVGRRSILGLANGLVNNSARGVATSLASGALD